ncbi:MAG TPA: hypothetical protein VJY39_08395 [Acidisphaera sp.]|nr:hypothetical protein [Acidisphaera sp.]
MSRVRRYKTVLAVLLPAGVLGMSSALAAAPAEPQQVTGTTRSPIAGTGDAARNADVANQLGAIRRAMSGLAAGDTKVAAVWQNYDGHWRSWHNWGNG